jgi:histidyl-tRNA synthetase
MSKVSIPKGTRDFLPDEVIKREFIFDTCRRIFKLHGFSPVETPAIEKIETLTGKYGDEGDQLLFKIAQRGEKLNQALDAISNAETRNLNQLTDMALRYDLTVPFARFVVQHQNDIVFPFKRYQIQNVWRADKPQKGRYREFYQCDVDIIGSKSLMNEASLISIMIDVFNALRLKDVTIKINHRKVLEGIAEVIGKPEAFQDITIAIDKIDKIGIESCLNILGQSGFNSLELEKLKAFLTLEGDVIMILDSLKRMLQDSVVGMEGVSDLIELFTMVKKHDGIKLDLSLARGLNYYTGCIFEVVAEDFPSSITGGGRYDDLTGIFGLRDMSGVGVSFGADRIYDLMLHRQCFQKSMTSKPKILFINLGQDEVGKCMEYATELREYGISVDIFPDNSKFAKQMKYADKSGIKYVGIVGQNELDAGVISLKDLNTGDQSNHTIDELILKLK